jgi:hypothetical protein
MKSRPLIAHLSYVSVNHTCNSVLYNTLIYPTLLKPKATSNLISLRIVTVIKLDFLQNTCQSKWTLLAWEQDDLVIEAFSPSTLTTA